ncbi:DsbA family protein [Bradyrhizobium rifense]|uniref:DsbA family protein n=1 Tax=Bradyrhizobium rifense TaxID=515499 RepID=UPI001FEAD6BF|nr:DsbA family protein [Bradyrhizobium rifense]
MEYGDYQCPFCASACAVVDQPEPYFEGQIRFVFRHFPLAEVHPYAEVAAESAEFAGAAGVFWEMHEALFRSQAILSVPTIMRIAEKLRLSETMMRHALETGQFRSNVRNDFMGGVRSGVNGTPTFFINGVRHEGPFDFASLASAIQIRLTADSHA